MGHRPFPDAARARHQIGRSRITWVTPTAGRDPWLLIPSRIDVAMVAPSPVLPQRFQWKLMDGNEQRWSGEHTLEGPCPACCCNGPKACSECGGREHSEPAEGMTADGWEAVDALMCQEQREDGIGDPAETRDLPGTQ